LKHIARRGRSNGEVKMPVIELTPQAYQLVVERAEALQRPLTEVASELILTEATASIHPYVERRVGVLGGKPVVKGTRLPVWQLAERLQLGDSPEDLLDAYQHISAAALYDAISYYYDHRLEIQQQIEQNRLEIVLEAYNATLNEDGRIIFAVADTHA
jgi:uncharacterized protein (DUF433 family)